MLPEAKYYSPSANIAWLVRQFEFIRYGSPKRLTDKFVPRADAAIVFNFRSLPRMASPVRQTLPPFFIAPVCPTANSISINGPSDAMITVCNPTVLSRILGISLAPGTGICVPLPHELFHPLWYAMRDLEEPERRMEAFSRFMNSLCPGGYTPDDTDISYDLISLKGLNTQLQEIIRELPVSERTLQRRFRNRLGTTPKMLVRIIRINCIWDAITAGERIDYHDLVFLGNYFDQTHMIKDFKSITGETPDVFFRRNLGIARIMSGK
jgi:AraC-like DNA-binding protein